MPGNEIRISRRVEAAPERVWAVLTDIDGADQTLSGVTGVERVSGEGYRVGTRWRETRRMFDKEATEEMWVAEVDPPHRTVVKAHSAGTDYTTTFDLSPAGDGTELTMTFSATVGSSTLHRLLAATLGRLAMKATARAMSTDLQDIATRVERA
ncbi:SRPBCC family protein [Rhodococcus olei]|uniref:SRPBCC family protein n=1 Tax=Rhodococcus olei TaxID=2161675 RepID=A0ABP8P5B1_9NOCA